MDIFYLNFVGCLSTPDKHFCIRGHHDVNVTVCNMYIGIRMSI